MVFLCQPNNPTGQLAEPALVEALLRRCEAVGAVLAVDECFLDFLPEGEGLSAKQDVYKRQAHSSRMRRLFVSGPEP